MATKKTAGQNSRRARFSEEFEQQALLRAVKDGVPTAARELGLEPAQLPPITIPDRKNRSRNPTWFA